jgi:hypothetical protein
MASTCADIIAYALKLGKVIPSGGSATTGEAADGLACLQSMYDGWVVGGMFGNLEDVYLDADDVAEEGKRYFVPTGITLTAATSLYVDLNGDTRQPRDLALYESLTAAGTRTVKLYDRVAWVSLTGLASGDAAPLASRGAMGLAACLATAGAFNDMFGGEIGEGTALLAGQFVKQLMSKSGSTQDEPTGTYY